MDPPAFWQNQCSNWLFSYLICWWMWGCYCGHWQLSQNWILWISPVDAKNCWSMLVFFNTKLMCIFTWQTNAWEVPFFIFSCGNCLHNWVELCKGEGLFPSKRSRTFVVSSYPCSYTFLLAQKSYCQLIFSTKKKRYRNPDRMFSWGKE